MYLRSTGGTNPLRRVTKTKATQADTNRGATQAEATQAKATQAEVFTQNTQTKEDK